MMETPTKYRVTTYPTTDRRSQTLNNVYAKTVKEFMLAMIAADYSYSSDQALVDRAIALADSLIEKVGEKS